MQCELIGILDAKFIITMQNLYTAFDDLVDQYDSKTDDVEALRERLQEHGIKDDD